MLSRALAQVEAMGQPFAWHKTVRWSRAVEKRIVSDAWVSTDVPTVFYQTLAAPVLATDFEYVIYTDRVAREGALEEEAYRSTWGPGWDEREAEFLRRARAVLVMGPSSQRALVDLYGIDESRTAVIGAGPGTHVGPIGTEIRPPRRLLFVGTNWGLKGGPEVLEAFDRLLDRYPAVELVLAGSEPDRALPPRTRSLGRVPAETMPDLFASADLFVVPTYMEALGYSLLEALMHGLPAVGSTVGNQSWLIGDAGLTVQAGDVDVLVKALDEILEDYAAYKARAIQRAGQLRALMTWDRVAASIVAALDDSAHVDDLAGWQ
jgi:glycosyltransferase involved in cell wall biosynthesis